MDSLPGPRLVVTDPEDAASATADLLAEVLRRPRPVLGLATGSSVEATYRHLAELVRRDADLRAGARCATGFALDEYVGIDRSSPQSYWATLEAQVAGPLGMPPENLHVPLLDERGDASAYDRAIAEAGGVDLQLLGLGANGHIGFNEPGSSFASVTRRVELDEQTRLDNARFFPSATAVPTEAVTQGIATIMRAKSIVVLAFGLRKARALERALFGPLTPRLPASVLREHQDVTVFADPEAASLLEHRCRSARSQAELVAD
ncbi:glucosamine-6-phosphate deaminase [Leifsonia sp. AG29]|uniref:glucosamine-6-phosphate deaminase n=1 Tax=Leifsonia sp. AG29 TaxID=2598860 RepID=UPI00131B3811|nr:glucosamine-6-phosphate deaminase [Leifsonia sp. AG29]